MSDEVSSTPASDEPMDHDDAGVEIPLETVVKTTGMPKGKKLRFPNMEKGKLNKLAKDIAMGKVFCSCYMHPSDQEHFLGMVFMPLMFGGLADMPKEMIDDIGFVYEYFDKAGPRSVNGYPIFFSCAMVSKADAKRIGAKVNKIKKMLEEI